MAAPGLGLPTRPWRPHGDQDLGHDDKSGYDERGTISLAAGEVSADQWQYRSIGELKQEQATREDQQVTVFPEGLAVDARRLRGQAIGRATCAAEVNVSGTDADESDKRRKHE